MKGTIFSVEEFAVNDGPGIRTTIFLKGCPLRCSWCHNPEGISFEPEYLTGADGSKRLSGEIIDSEELAARILRNEKIYAMNEGGVTFTGGEPLAQGDFLLDVASKIKGRVHVAIETSGYAPAEIFMSAARAVDIVLFDIKTTDAAVHKKFTGADNALILDNLKRLCSSGVEFIARIPLIPSVNDNPENMARILEILKGAKNLRRVEILPYNNIAGAKYKMLGKTFSPNFDASKAPRVFDVFTKEKINCVVL